jgi:hypothetical protein
MSRRSGLSYFAVEGGSINTACARDALLLRSNSKSCVCANVAGDLRVGERSGRRLYSCTAPSRRPDTVPISAKELVGRCGTAD